MPRVRTQRNYSANTGRSEADKRNFALKLRYLNAAFVGGQRERFDGWMRRVVVDVNECMENKERPLTHTERSWALECIFIILQANVGQLTVLSDTYTLVTLMRQVEGDDERLMQKTHLWLQGLDENEREDIQGYIDSVEYFRKTFDIIIDTHVYKD